MLKTLLRTIDEAKLAKPATRPYSLYSYEAIALLGQLVRRGRIERKITAAELAERAAPRFLVSAAEAVGMAQRQVTIIRDRWGAVCAEARMSEVDRHLLWRRRFLNPFAFEGAPPQLAALVA